MFTPLPEMSGFTRPSSVGPQLLNPDMATLDGPL